MVFLALSIMRSFLQLCVLMFNPFPLMTKSLSLLYQTLKVFWNGDCGIKFIDAAISLYFTFQFNKGTQDDFAYSIQDGR